MTTPQAAERYLQQHLATVNGKPTSVYNPNNKPVEDLPVIYGFNNGGSPGWYEGVILAEDGKCLGGHICSHEGYMPYGLGMIEGRPDRHEAFTAHYPNGWRCAFVKSEDLVSHKGIDEACRLNQLAGEEEQ
jgi:hypothetical protein